MENPACLAIAEGLAMSGLVALAWEYRPRPGDGEEVGAARARLWTDPRLDDVAQRDIRDALLVACWLDALPLGEAGGLAACGGYSYGALIAALAVEGAAPCFLLSAPLAALDGRELLLERRSLRVVAEEDFDVTSAQGVAVGGACVTLPGTDHLFAGAAEIVRKEARAWGRSLVPQSSPGEDSCQASSLL
jgi:alpha/beta superfamily hydrolase